MSPALNGSSAIWRFKHSNAIEIHDRITFDFYMGLPHMHEERDCLTSIRNYMSLMRFIDLNLDINDIRKYSRRVNWIHSPVLFRFESMKGLGHTHKYSISFTHSQAKLPMLQQKVNNEIHESQHTLTLPLDS